MTKIEAARALIEARNRLLDAEAVARRTRDGYIENEKAYFAACKAARPCAEGDYPSNLLVDGTIIMPVEDWYDSKDGSRLTFHTVEVAK